MTDIKNTNTAKDNQNLGNDMDKSYGSSSSSAKQPQSQTTGQDRTKDVKSGGSSASQTGANKTSDKQSGNY